MGSVVSRHGRPQKTMLALALAASLAACPALAQDVVAAASPGAAGFDLLDLPSYDQARGGGDRRPVTLAGLVLDGKDLPVALALRAAEGDAEADIAVESLLRGLGLDPRIGEDGSWLAETPLGLARLPRNRMQQVDGVDYASFDALKEMLGVDLRYDEGAAAVVATTTWPLAATPTVPAGVEVERPDAEAVAPDANLSYWRTEANYVHSDDASAGQLYSDVGGGLAGGFWRARYEDDLEGSQRLTDYAWVRTAGRQRWLLGNQDVNSHPLLTSFELTGAQMAWTNQPESLYGSRLAYGELVSGRLAPSSQLRGSGPPGGIAELMYDGIVVARVSIPLDGRYEFRDLDQPRGTSTRVQVALYERGGLGAPVRIEDRSGTTSDQLLEQGTVLHYAGTGEYGNPLDPDDPFTGAASFYEGRFGVLPGLTLDVAGQRIDGRDQWLAGGVASLGLVGIYSGHVARTDGHQAWLVQGEGQRAAAFWRLLAREEDAGFRLGSLQDSHERYAEAGVRGERWALGLVGRDIDGDYVSEPVRYLKPSAEWFPTDSLSFSARPDLEGEYQYSAQWAPGLNTRLSAYLNADTDRYEFEQRFAERWRVNVGRVEYLDRERHSVLFSRDRRRASDLGFSLGALESEGRFGYLASLDSQLRPGMTLRLQAYDDPLAFGSVAGGPVFQLNFVADFAVTPQGLSAGQYRRSLVELGGVSGSLEMPAGSDGEFALAGASVWVDGQRRGEIDENGRFHVRDLRPGVYRVQVDEGNLPIEMRLERAERWVEVKAGVVTPVTYPLSLRLGFAGQVRDAAGQPAVAQELLVLSADGSTLGSARSDAWGYFRVDDLAPGRYRVRLADGTEREVVLTDEFEFGVDLRQSTDGR